MEPDLEALPPLVDGELELHLTECSRGDPIHNRYPAYRFELRVHGQRAGTASLRLGSGEYLERYAGHIGYGVEHAFRGHHYAARACRLLFPLARRHGLTTLWITCNPENVASRRTCEWLGGTLVDIVDVPADTDIYKEGDRQKCRYKFEL